MKRSGNAIVAILVVLTVAIAAFLMNSGGDDASGQTFTAKVQTRVSTGRVLFMLQLKDSSGRYYNRVPRSLARKMNRPSVEVFDSSGKKVHSFRVRYG